MGKILVASTPLLGHVSPMLAVAAALKQNGHDVVFLTGEAFRHRVTEQGIAFASLQGYANYDWQNLNVLLTPEEAVAQGLEGHIVHLKRLFADAIPDQYRSLEDAIHRHNAELVVVDVLYMGVLPLLLRRGSRPPVISCGVIAPMWRDAGFSPSRGAGNSPEAQARNIADGLQFDAAVRPGTIYIDQVLESLGVAVPGGFRMFDTMYRLPDKLLQFTTKEFEYPLVESRDNLLFVGPILSSPAQERQTPKWLRELDASKPLVLVTQGTLANTNFDQLVNPVITALAGEPVTVVATAGGGDAGRILRASNAIVESYIPYDLVLPRASVLVTNGGYNGVQQALAFGVPVVSAGATEDKPYVSARVAWSGAGIDLKTGNPTPEQVRLAVQQVLQAPHFRQRALTLSESIRATDALTTVASVVNALLPRLSHSPSF